MKVKVQQIVWHNKEPVFSVDFHPSGVLATAGADSEIKLWKVDTGGEKGLEAEFLSSITGDKFESGYKTWNCVRFCPNGTSLAAAGDAGQIYNWKPSQGQLTHATAGQLHWMPTNCGAYSTEDVMDLSWASDGSGFVSASNDMTCMFWDPELKGSKARLKLEGHRLFVQGVAWDPQHQALVTQAADRSCRVYSMRQAVPGTKKKTGKKQYQMIQRLEGFYCSHVMNKCNAGCAMSGVRDGGKAAGQNLFFDDSLGSFFRRLAWSPDVRKLVDQPQTTTNVAYVYAKGQWTTPLLQLPVSSKPVVAVRFCPVLFELGEVAGSDLKASIDLPYRMVFAMATKDSVLIYDTQGFQPLVVLAGLHLETITDLAWSIDAQTLAISSYDGYCSIAAFEENELGRPMPEEKLPRQVRACLWSTVAGKEADSPGKAVSQQTKSLAPEVVSRLGSATPEAATGVLHTRKFGPPQAAQLPPGRSTDSGLPTPNTASNIRRIAPVAVAVASGDKAAASKKRRIVPAAINLDG